MHQLPTVLPSAMIATCMIPVAGKCRHTSKPDSVFDNPEQFSVAQVLRLGLPKIRRLGIEAITDRRVSAAVVTMASRTVIREM